MVRTRKHLTTVVLLLAALTSGCGGSSGAGEQSSAPTTPAASAGTPTQPDPAEGLDDIEAAGAVRIEATSSPDWVAPAPDGVWVSGTGAGVAWFGADGQAPAEGVEVLSVCSAMDVGFGSVWVPACLAGQLVRIDLATHKVAATIDLPSDYLAEEGSVAAGSGRVWVLDAGDPPRLIAVDPSRDRAVRTVRAPEGAAALRTGFGSLWVSDYSGAQVHRLDVRTGRAQATVPVGNGPRFLAVGPDAVWVMNQDDGSVSRIDPATNEVVATVDVSSAPIRGGDIAASGGAVWVRTEEALAVEIDPTSNTVTRKFGPASGSGSVAITDDAVWLSAHDVESLWRLPTT